MFSFTHCPECVAKMTLRLHETEGEIPSPNEEIDSWAWMTVEEARQKIRPDSLAKQFLEGYCTKRYIFANAEQ